ncbi:MAG: nicotianamine synthase family protein [Methanobrevibacter sp.]|uniref:nicotianamine synthase family protein n=1 Tax=Methanobrevibacter sp. TaxID=66852 RepID=UPI0026E019CF|nr:nicotianamine synthase family protein [Methanobrevibacter sp.]MDO5848029.1 nicotianamine synthase family protein [Methanobrevibacter sp.]
MSCYKYWGKISEIADNLLLYGDLDKYGESALDNVDINDIIELLDEVEIIAHDNTIDFDSAKHILDDEKMNRALKLIREFYVYVGARLETENALKILESDNPKATLDSFHFYDRYIGLINNESQLVRFNSQKTFVFLGSGPLPLTLIMFNKVFGCKCIGIEIQETVAELSREVLKKLNLENEIEIVVGDETVIKDLDYDILMVAALAEPKERVFSNIWEYVDVDTPIIYRTYTGMRAILYSPVTEKDTRGFHKEVMVLPTGNTNNTSVLIRKII